MIDKFEKKTDRHYTYLYKEDIGADFKNNIGWFIARREHQPGEKPAFNHPFKDIALGLSEEDAQAGVAQLQAEEMTRRAQLSAQHSGTPDLTAEATELENTQAKLKQLQSQRNVLEQMLAKVEREIRYNRKIVIANRSGESPQNNLNYCPPVIIAEAVHVH